MAAVDPYEDTADLELGRDRSLKSFYYRGGYLSIYKGLDEGLTRYYVTPLTELDNSSPKCFKPRIEDRYKIRFNVILWNTEVADEASKALAFPPLNLTNVRREHIQPLPIIKVRLSAQGLPNEYKPDVNWKSTINFRLQHTFTIYAETKEACERMVAEIRNDPEYFVTRVQLEIAMSAEKHYRTISITGQNVGQSKMFAQLQNMDQTNGECFLTSHDLNYLAQEILSSVVASEATTGDYIGSADELNFADLLERQLSSETINAQRLSSDEWKSVFWRDEFSRPDRYASYLNRALTYDKGTKTFSFDNETETAARRQVSSEITRGSSVLASATAKTEMSLFGVIRGVAEASASAGAPSRSSNNENYISEEDNKDRTIISQDQLQAFLKKNDVHVEWNGEVFVPKSLSLHRVNVPQLRHKSIIATHQFQIETIPITMKLDVVVPYREPDSVEEHFKILIDQIKAEFAEKLERIVENIDDTKNHVEQKCLEQIGDLKMELQGKITEQARTMDVKLQGAKMELQEKITDNARRIEVANNRLSARTGGVVSIENVDFRDNDILYWRGPFSGCRAACDSTSGCVAYVTHKDHGANCWLKARLEKSTPHLGRDAYIFTTRNN